MLSITRNAHYECYTNRDVPCKDFCVDILSLPSFEMGLSAVETAVACVSSYSVKEDDLFGGKECIVTDNCACLCTRTGAVSAQESVCQSQQWIFYVIHDNTKETWPYYYKSNCF